MADFSVLVADASSDAVSWTGDAVASGEREIVETAAGDTPSWITCISFTFGVHYALYVNETTKVISWSTTAPACA